MMHTKKLWRSKTNGHEFIRSRRHSITYGLWLVPGKVMSFEKGLSELQKLVKLLEQDDISLEQSVENFERGVKVAKYCERKLRDAEDKVKAILDQTDPQ
jgi:exodeoxyribonuclease VII small subunit